MDSSGISIQQRPTETGMNRRTCLQINRPRKESRHEVQVQVSPSTRSIAHDSLLGLESFNVEGLKVRVARDFSVVRVPSSNHDGHRRLISCKRSTEDHPLESSTTWQ